MVRRVKRPTEVVPGEGTVATTPAAPSSRWPSAVANTRAPVRSTIPRISSGSA
jgi:hypothetical protein